MKLLSHIFHRRVLFLVEFFISALLVGMLIASGLLPLKFLIPIILVLILLPIVFYRMQKQRVYRNKEGKKVRKTIPLNIIGKVLQVIICIALLFVDYNVFITTGFISRITSSGENYINYSVVVLKEDAASDIKDMSDYVFGYMTSQDASENANMNQVMTKISGDINEDVIPETYSELSDTLDALYDGDINALTINELDRDSFEEVNEKFSDETKVVATYQIKIATSKADSADVTNEAFTIFISGIDTYGSIDNASLSDVNMLATINPNTKQVLLISIPRDYYVTVHGLTGKDKLTHTARKGIECTEQTIEDFMGININYYLKMNYTSFMKVIDAIDGIDIYNPYGAFTARVDFIEIKEGWNHFNSKEALAWVRERHSFADGDVVRGKNQQIMIKAILKKLTSASSITKLSGIFDAVSDSMETNMATSEINSLINMEIDDMASWDVQSYHLNGTNKRTNDLALTKSPNPRGLYVMEPDTSTIEQGKKYIEQIVEGKELLKIEDTDGEIVADPNANDKYRK